jgi:hypoxanthine-guanine phosphoribosyltransferase
VGYGLDFRQLYRNIPYIFIPKPKYYQDEID